MHNDQLKKLVVWMRDQKVLAFKQDGLEVTFSPQAFNEAPAQATDEPALTPEQVQEQEAREYDRALFHSAG